MARDRVRFSGLYPELLRFPSAAAAKAALRRANRGVVKDIRYWLLCAGTLCLAGIWLRWYNRQPPSRLDSFVPLIGGGLGALAAAAGMWFCRRGIQRRLRQEL